MATQGKGLLAVWTDIPAHIEANFNRWYDEEHLAERAGMYRCKAPRSIWRSTIPSMLRCSQSDPTSGPGQYLPLDTAHSSALSEFCAQRV
jgi:hypothetical protein